MTRQFSLDKIQQWLNQGGFDIVAVSFDGQARSFCRIYTKSAEVSSQLSLIRIFKKSVTIEGLENFLVNDLDQNGIGDLLMQIFEIEGLEFF